MNRTESIEPIRKRKMYAIMMAVQFLHIHSKDVEQRSFMH